MTNYQVWRPGENILHRVRDLEYKCANDSVQWMQHLQQLRTQVTMAWHKGRE